MTKPKYSSPEEFIEDWEGMQKEFIEEDTMFRLDIPSVERTKEWMAEEKPILKVVHKVPPPFN
jgi:hypothetical protein